MTNLLSLQNISKSFAHGGGNVQALRNVSLTIEDGEFIAFVGASGCGKSTLLRLIAGLDQPDAGSITLAGTQVTGPSAACGMIFQDPRLLPWLSVAQNADLALERSGLSRGERKLLVSNHLELVGLSAFSRAFPKELSGGMAQRAAIARGLVTRPRLLLLDEPFSALDAFNRTRLQNELQNIWAREKTAMALVTHDVEEAVFLANRVVILAPHPGRISDIVTVDLPRPRQRDTIEFVQLKTRILQQLEGYAEAA